MFHSRVLWSSVFLFKGQSPVQVKIPGSFVCRCVTVFIFEISAWLLVTSKSCSFGFAVFSLHILHFNIRGFVTCLAFEFTVINSSVCLSGFSHRCDSFHKFESYFVFSALPPHTHTRAAVHRRWRGADRTTSSKPLQRAERERAGGLPETSRTTAARSRR